MKLSISTAISRDHNVVHTYTAFSAVLCTLSYKAYENGAKLSDKTNHWIFFATKTHPA